MSQLPNHVPALDAGLRLCLIRASLARASDAQRYMRKPLILCSLLVLFLSACSANRPDVHAQSKLHPPGHQAPVGTFVGEMIKLHLQGDSTYVAEDIGPAEFRNMADGNNYYLERIKFPPQRGRWTMDDLTGQLTLAPDISASFRWDTKHFQYDESSPNSLAWGHHAFLARAAE